MNRLSIRIPSAFAGDHGLSHGFLFLFSIFFILFTFSACESQDGKPPTKVCFKDNCIDVEIASNLEERAKGLQFRKTLGKNNGMLFIFQNSKRHTFWMKDTFISLDMVWIDSNKRIVTIMRDILPCTTERCPAYTPQKDALYVLEVNAGVTIELGLKVGDQAVFR